MTVQEKRINRKVMVGNKNYMLRILAVGALFLFLSNNNIYLRSQVSKLDSGRSKQREREGGFFGRGSKLDNEWSKQKEREGF